ncbi:MAG TPA: YbhB/YbcL family Raf kinase inhibitor-like protein [Alphaproteobacteria bacterium]|nr:YbhB/YbcL family Raf kinase inhibitor-like protein [Alphaproteobacteria bacterium]
MKPLRIGMAAIVWLVAMPETGWGRYEPPGPEGASAVDAARHYASLAYESDDIRSARANLRATVGCLSPERPENEGARACPGVPDGAISAVRDPGIAQQLAYARSEGLRALKAPDLTSARADALAAMDYLQSASIDESSGARNGTSAFTVASPTLADGDFISRQDAAASKNCGGQDISPPVQWSNEPSGTRSFAVTMFDPDGDKGLGFTHWIIYDIPKSVHVLSRGAGDAPSEAFVAGTNSNRTKLYSGPCPPAGNQPHHYVISVYALDLAPGELGPGLDRDAFLRAIGKHSLAEASLVVRYER